MLIEKKTWCPRCSGNLVREQRVIRVGGLWPKKLWVIYKCVSCSYESLIEFKLNKRMAKRIRAMDELVKDSETMGEYK